MKKLSNLFTAASLLLSHAMCVVVAYNYRDMLCGIVHSCYSAPAWVAFLHILPFSAAIILCLTIAFFLRRKEYEILIPETGNKCLAMIPAMK